MISDEQIVGAVMRYGTTIEAAQALGCDPSTIYRRMRTSSVQALYHSFQADMLRQTVEDLCEARDDALTVVQNIMNDPDVNAAIRLQAAQTILSNDIRYAERLAQVEDKVNNAVVNSIADALAMDMVEKQKDLEERRKQNRKEMYERK